METITLKMDETMLKNIDACLKENNYSTRTEFIRDAVRQKLVDLEMRPRITEEQKKRALENIARLRGSMKGKFKLNDREAREEAYQELMKEKGWSD